MDPLFLCKTCGHDYEDHISGERCAYCWADSREMHFNGCYKFVGDNLKWLEERQKNKEEGWQ